MVRVLELLFKKSNWHFLPELYSTKSQDSSRMFLLWTKRRRHENLSHCILFSRIDHNDYQTQAHFELDKIHTPSSTLIGPIA